MISDRIVELHFERSKDFGQDVECYAENSAGADSKRERIPCKYATNFFRLKKVAVKIQQKCFAIAKHRFSQFFVR